MSTNNEPLSDIALVWFSIAREWVEQMDIVPAATMLDRLVANADTLRHIEGRVALDFTGWDADPRELQAIPEVVAWFRLLTAARPYWFVLCEPPFGTLGVVFKLLSQGQIVAASEPGAVAWRFKDGEVSRIMRRLFAGQNDLLARRGLRGELGGPINERVIGYAQQALGLPPG